MIRGFFLILILVGCNSSPTPKPDAFLALEYPQNRYQTQQNNCHFQFDHNEISHFVQGIGCSFRLEYPLLKATLFVTKLELENNLEQLLGEVHLKLNTTSGKRNVIQESAYANDLNKVYGSIFSVEGNAASNLQFYATDSTKSFLSGTLYFLTKPNYDSLYPAIDYIKKDVRKFMETLRWVE